MADDAKTCPRCAETIRAKAIVCRHCGFAYDTQDRSLPDLDLLSPPRFTPNWATIAAVALVVAVLCYVSGFSGPTIADLVNRP